MDMNFLLPYASLQGGQHAGMSVPQEKSFRGQHAGILTCIGRGQLVRIPLTWFPPFQGVSLPEYGGQLQGVNIAGIRSKLSGMVI